MIEQGEARLLELERQAARQDRALLSTMERVGILYIVIAGLLVMSIAQAIAIIVLAVS